MKKLIPFLLFASSVVSAQNYVIRQSSQAENRRITFDMVDATDGYTSETGLSPTCTIMAPWATSYSSCIASPVEVGTGTYSILLSAREIQNLGQGSLYITGVGSRPARVKFKVIDSGSQWADGASLIAMPSQFNNTTTWAKTGVTVTEDSTADYLGDSIADTLTGDGASSRHKVSATIPDPGGSGEIYFTAEVKSGSLNNAWIGNDSASHIWGVDLNTSTGVVTPNSDGRLRGWKVEALASSWWRIHLLATERPTDGASYLMTIALNDGTGGNSPSTFTTSGTMIFARAYAMRAEDVNPALIAELMPNLQSASSTTSVTLAGTETTGTDILKNREICFYSGYVASSYGKAGSRCSCITAYNGTTKVATLSPALDSTMSSSVKYRIGGTCLNTITSVSGSVGSVAGAVGSVTANVNAQVVGMNADTVTASAVASNAITSSELAQSAADKVWNTAPENGTSGTALGYLDAIKKYVANKMTIVGSDYEIFKDDQTTSYATGTTNSAGRDPD